MSEKASLTADEAGLLEAIRDGDELARMSYADLMEERGNATRAAMLRREWDRGVAVPWKEAFPELSRIAHKCGALLLNNPVFMATPRGPTILVDGGLAVKACLSFQRWLRWGRALAAIGNLDYATVPNIHLIYLAAPRVFGVVLEQRARCYASRVEKAFWKRMRAKEILDETLYRPVRYKEWPTVEEGWEDLSEAILDWAYDR